AREPGKLGVQPDMEISHQRNAEFLAHGKTLGCALAIGGALDVEQGVKLLHGLKRDRVDEPGLFTPALALCRAHDIGKFEKLAARVGKTSSLQHGAWLSRRGIELAIAAIGIGLQDAG